MGSCRQILPLLVPVVSAFLVTSAILASTILRFMSLILEATQTRLWYNPEISSISLHLIHFIYCEAQLSKRENKPHNSMHNVYTYSAVKCFIKVRRETLFFSPFYCEMNYTAFDSLHVQICYLCALLKTVLHYVGFMCACEYISDPVHCHLGHSLETPWYSRIKFCYNKVICS